MQRLTLLRKSYFRWAPTASAAVTEHYTDGSKATIYWPTGASKTALAHELAHVILRTTGRHTEAPNPQYEIEAWELAKDLIKPSLWNEREALLALRTYGVRRRIIKSWHRHCR